MSHSSIEDVAQMRAVTDLGSNDSKLHSSVGIVLMETIHPAKEDQDRTSKALL